MARKTKPTYFDDERDKILLEWLKGKGNFSAYVRIKMYELMNNETKGIGMYQAPVPPQQEQEKKSKNNNYVNKMMNSAKR